MKINVTHVNPNPWKPADAGPDFRPIYTIYVDGMGEPQKTMNPALAVVGEHEAYEKPSKSGKLYWETAETAALHRPVPPPRMPQNEKQFKADPDTRSSIEKQQALIQAVKWVEAKEVSLEYTLSVATDMLNWFSDPSYPTSTPDAPDLPPVEVYEDLSGYEDSL